MRKLIYKRRFFSLILISLFILGVISVGIGVPNSFSNMEQPNSTNIVKDSSIQMATENKVGCSGDGFILLNLTKNMVEKAIEFSGFGWGSFFVQLPPNSRLENVTIVESQYEIRSSLEYPTGAGGRNLTEVLEWREARFRVYQFAILFFAQTVIDSSDINKTTPPFTVNDYNWIYVNVSYTQTGPLLDYVEYDDLVDGIIDEFNQDYPPITTFWVNSTWKAFQPYSVNSSSQLPENDFDYLVISPEFWADNFQQLITWKNQKGVSSEIITIEWINSTYYGIDTTEKIREFIKDAFNTWRIRYILLVGDTEHIPTRMTNYTVIVNNNTLCEEQPNDWYYACLDGDWDKNNNGFYGETLSISIENPDETDIFPEIIVSRLPASNETELDNMISKIVQYEQNPQMGPWNQTMLHTDALPDAGNSQYFLEKSSETFPPNLQIKELYYSISPYNLTAENVINCIQEGVFLVTSYSHGGPSGWNPFNYEIVEDLKNEPYFPLFLIGSCETAPFDYPDYIAKRLLTCPDGGAIAFIGAVRPFGGVGLPPLFTPHFFNRTGYRYGPALLFATICNTVKGTGYGMDWSNSGWTACILGDPETAIPVHSEPVNCNVTFEMDPPAGKIIANEITRNNGETGIYVKSSYSGSRYRVDAFMPGYHLAEWQTNGSIVVDDYSSSDTYMTVIGNGTLKAIFKEGWDVILNATLNGFSDLSEFGVRNNATDFFDTLYDQLDSPVPPVISAVMTYARIQHLSVNKVSPSDRMTWIYEVRTTDIEGTIQIYWSANQIASIPFEYTVSLLDSTESIIADMRQITEHSFTTEPYSTYNLTIEVSLTVEHGLIAVVRGFNNYVYLRTFNLTDDSWGNWIPLPGSTVDTPAAAQLEDELHIVVRGMDEHSLWHGYYNLTSDAFVGWTMLQGSSPSPPVLTSNGTVLCLVVHGMDDLIYYRIYSEGAWGGWQLLPDGATIDSPAAALLGNELHVVVRGMDGFTMWHKIIVPGGGVVQEWTWIPGASASPPILTASQSRAELFMLVRGADDGIYYCEYEVSWGGWTSLQGLATASPGATICGDELHVVVCGSDAVTLWHGIVDLDSEVFGGWNWISGSTPSAPTLTN